MDSLTLIAVASIVIAGLTTGFGTMGPALAEGRAVATALTALAQQPDASATITRTYMVRPAMQEPLDCSAEGNVAAIYPAS
ncbi:ATP F0F1 synthase subunit C [Lamprobacter modestohalophilus]|uniref:ATP F0F1 synthase subunit C n=1 Tax=Lamprobacter modestohalophilus TaxID=1064514 RepID=UPI001F5BF8CC|nr:ATP F0F1 synthase subunit C [Lamprobacter modestohalophilus]